jgi:hypothetical protein
VKKKPAQSSRSGLYVVIVIGIVIIALVVGTSYFTDQARISGQRFGNSLDQIQSDLKKETFNYESKKKIWQEEGLTKYEIQEISEKHLEELGKIVKKYDELIPPQDFISSVELLKRSTQIQMESVTFLIEWIKTGDNSTKIRSDELMQQSFEYETSGLASYYKAKKGYTP